LIDALQLRESLGGRLRTDRFEAAGATAAWYLDDLEPVDTIDDRPHLLPRLAEFRLAAPVGEVEIFGGSDAGEDPPDKFVVSAHAIGHPISLPVRVVNVVGVRPPSRGRCGLSNRESVMATPNSGDSVSFTDAWEGRLKCLRQSQRAMLLSHVLDRLLRRLGYLPRTPG
jgi:hypothetical protein